MASLYTQFQKWFPHHPSKSKENDFPATVFQCVKFCPGCENCKNPMDPVLSISRAMNHCFHQSLPQNAAQVVPRSSLLPPPPIRSRPLSPWPWRHSPLTGTGTPARGDFTLPITLTTAQIKRCHLNHKKQSTEAGELRQSHKKGKERGRKRERERECKGVLLPQKIKTQSPLFRLNLGNAGRQCN